MHATDTRYKLYLLRLQIVIILSLCSLVELQGQNLNYDNLWDYDEQNVHYGFLIGVHSSDYRIKYNDAFVSPGMDSLHSIAPGKHFGFKLGFVVDLYLFQYLSFRITPTVAFYEYDLTYRYVDGQDDLLEFKDATMLEIPLLFKYKSARRGNLNMYLIAGPNFQFEAAGRGDGVRTRQKLELKNFNTTFDVGMGFDIFYELFKFTPEIRYSFGFRNLLPDTSNDFDSALSKLTTHNVTAFITFEGGPTYLKRRKGKY